MNRFLVLVLSTLISVTAFAGPYDDMIPTKSLSIEEARTLALFAQREVEKSGSVLKAEIEKILKQKDEATADALKKKDACKGNLECVRKVHEDLRATMAAYHTKLAELQGPTGEISNKTKLELLNVVEGAMLGVLLRAMETEFEALKAEGYVLETPMEPSLLLGKTDPVKWFEANGHKSNQSYFNTSTSFGLRFFFRDQSSQTEVVGVLTAIENSDGQRRYDSAVSLILDKNAATKESVFGVLREDVRKAFTTEAKADYSWVFKNPDKDYVRVGLIFAKFDQIKF